MERIHELDRQLTNLFGGFDAIAQDMSFEVVGDLLEVDRESLAFCGIYCIEIWAGGHQQTVGEWMEQFKTAWDREEFKKMFVPSCQKARMRLHKEIQEWMPLYIGKANNIKRRLNEHIDLALDKRTFALKLRERGLLRENRFRLGVLRLPIENYDLIAPKLEAALRSRIRPLVGKQ